jgi:divalent metal cation (Fe/Co/Zn/Cd) transporter
LRQPGAALHRLKQAQRPPDGTHPLGYGRLSYFWSFLVAILLFSLGGLFSIYEGWHKLHALNRSTRRGLRSCLGNLDRSRDR